MQGYINLNDNNLYEFPNSKVHGAHMGPTWVDRTQVGPMLAQWNLTISDIRPVDFNGELSQPWGMNKHNKHSGVIF